MIPLKRTATLAGIILLVGLASLWASPIKGNKPETEIGKIMKQGFGGYPPTRFRPLQKVLDGKASAEDKEKLVKLCEELTKTKPPRGDEKGWKDLTTLILEDAKAVAAGKGDQKEILKKLDTHTNCDACHKAYAPEK